MTGYREVPLDGILEAPLPIWIDPSFNHFENLPEHQQREDEHHIWYRRKDYDFYCYIQNTSRDELAKRKALAYYALRSSRVQRLPRWDHDLWHKIYGSPRRPVSELHIFAATTLLAAKYLPDRAVSFNHVGTQLTVGLPLERRQQIWKQEAVYPADIDVVRRYLLRYIVAKGLDPNASVIDEFVHAGELAARIEKGAALIRTASQEATAGRAESAYNEAFQGQYLPDDQPDDMAHCVYNLIAQGNETDADCPNAVAWLGEILGAPLPTEEVAV